MVAVRKAIAKRDVMAANEAAVDVVYTFMSRVAEGDLTDAPQLAREILELSKAIDAIATN
jgi:hypothetical protein